MLTTNNEVLRVAFPRGCNTQQTTENNATMGATPMQRNSLKALANAALKRNDARNSDATAHQKDAQQTGEKSGCFVARSEGDFQPLTNVQLADLITRAAKANGLDPLEVWRWLDREDIEALRSGDPAEIRAFRAMIASPGWDSTPPAVLHGLPFPGGQHQRG